MLDRRHQRLVDQNVIYKERRRKEIVEANKKIDKYHLKWGIKLHNPGWQETFKLNQKIRAYKKWAYVVTHWSDTPPGDTILVKIIVFHIPRTLPWMRNSTIFKCIWITTYEKLTIIHDINCNNIYIF
jgi:hypothetical protein